MAAAAKICLLTAVLAVWMDPAVGRIELSPPRPWINGSVTFIVTGVQGRIRFYDWYRGSDTNADNQIFRQQEGFSPVEGRRYFKEAIGFTNGSMQIVNLQKDFEGPYTVEIQADNLLQYTTRLTILDKEPEPLQGLSDGAIAGISIGVGVLVIALITGGIFAYKKKSASPANDATYEAVHKETPVA